MLGLREFVLCICGLAWGGGDVCRGKHGLARVSLPTEGNEAALQSRTQTRECRNPIGGRTFVACPSVKVNSLVVPNAVRRAETRKEYGGRQNGDWRKKSSRTSYVIRDDVLGVAGWHRGRVVLIAFRQNQNHANP